MSNLHFFELINAAPGMSHHRLLMATLLASWLIALVPIAWVLAWVRGDEAARLDLLQIMLSVALALVLAQGVALVWPQPRPLALHLGTQYLDHGSDPGLPSDHVTVFWSLALSALRSRRFALWGFPLLAVGLLVGWSRIYLGVQFPLDIAAALPVAWAGTMAAGALRKPLMPFWARMLLLHDRWAGQLRDRIRALRKT
jgi:undecaprenyl-diphosphatase